MFYLKKEVMMVNRNKSRKPDFVKNIEKNSKEMEKS
jgi:hypothetical protein